MLAHGDLRALSSSLAEAHPLLAAADHARMRQRCADCQSWVWDGARLDMLHPLAGDYALNPKSNALSCVLRARRRRPQPAAHRRH